MLGIVAVLASPVRAADDEVPGSEPSKSGHGGPSAVASFELSGYTDTDAVQVASPSVAGNISDDVAGWTVNGRYLLDAVTAASVDIVSTASGRWVENRHVGSAGASYKKDDLSFALSGGVSSEPDYLSIGAGGTFTMDMMGKNFTPFVGYSYGHDDVGRTGLPRGYWQTMQKNAGQVGATFVVDRSTIAGVVIDAIFERGYLAKPYRYVPLFAPGTSKKIPGGASIRLVNEARLDQRAADQVPDGRNRFAFTGRMAHRFDGLTVRGDERLYRDNWGLSASTTEVRVMVDLGRNLMVAPHGRFHTQGHVDFWQRAYETLPGPQGVSGLPAFRTGDRELGSLYTATVGGGLRWLLTEDRKTPWTFFANYDWGYTRYFDALYITDRRAMFGAMGIEVGME